MSITRCVVCERQVDTDFEEMSESAFDLGRDEVCLKCENYYILSWHDDSWYDGVDA